MNSGWPEVLGDGRMEYVTAWGLRRDLEYGVCQGWGVGSGGGTFCPLFLPVFTCFYVPGHMAGGWCDGYICVT